MKTIHLFASTDNFDIKEVGGKAKALIELTQAGLPVPCGFVLPVDYFSVWIAQIKALELWQSILREITNEKCMGLKQVIETLKYSERQERLLLKAIEQIPSDCYAVRSSSPEEDLQDSSFAGMYETYLGITKEALKESVKKAFFSAFDYRVLAYKRQLGLSLTNTKIAVIVQQQIASKVSGIGFSINPLTNNYDEVVLNASFGLGEYIVSGKVSPDNYVFDTVANHIKTQKIASKPIGLFLETDGHVEERVCPNAEQPALTETQVKAVSALIKKCEAYYGRPIDTEWAYDDKGLHLLQARPITTYFPLYPELETKDKSPKQLYFDMVKMSQGFQWSMTTLGSDMLCELIKTAKQGFVPVGVDGAIWRYHGRVYMLMGNLVKMYGAKMVQKMIGVYDPSYNTLFENFPFDDYMPEHKPKGALSAKLNALKFAAKLTPSLLTAKKDYHKAIRDYYSAADQCFAKIDSLKSSTLPFDAQCRAVFDTYELLIVKIMPVMVAILTINTLKKMFKGQHLDEEIMALNMNLKGNPTSQMGQLQVEIAKHPDFQSCESFGDFKFKLKNNGFSKDFLTRWHNYMQRYGCRCIGEIDFANKRTWEDLSGFYTLLRQINTDENALDRVAEKKAAAYKKLYACAIRLGKEKQFLRAAQQIEWTGLREHPKYVYVYALNVLRQNALEIAKKFVLQGRLGCEQDIFMLDRAQITLAQNDSQYDIQQIVDRENADRKITQHIKTWPTIFDSRGEIFSVKRPQQDGVMQGESVSPGVVKGRAVVMQVPLEKKLEKGDILVTVATEPSWTPIFINAAGVVMEVGGMLQHGAIIAREYGLPCVTGIEGATQKIKDGDMIEVNGTDGYVKICINTKE